MDRNKKELKKIEEKHKEELENQKNLIIEDFDIKFNNFRMKILKETQEEIINEKDNNSKLLKIHIERLENQMNEERDRVIFNYQKVNK